MIFIDEIVATEVMDSRGNPTVKVTVSLSYYDGKSVISMLKRASKPSLRVYRASKKIPVLWGGLGVVIVSTSKGLMTDFKAKELKLGGEIICYVA